MASLQVTSAPARDLQARRVDNEGAVVPLLTPKDLSSAAAFEGLLLGLGPADLRRLQDLLGGRGHILDPWLRAAVQGTTPPSDEDQIQTILDELLPAVHWKSQTHLLESTADDRHVVIEIDNDARTHLRFGDGELGRAADAGETFWVNYRIGNGPHGNIGAEKLAHLVYEATPVTGITKVRNPLSARGGTLPETLAHARQHAPRQFRKQQRAITTDEYARLVLNDFRSRVQGARARLDWTGSSTVVTVAVDAKAGVDVDVLLQDVRDKLETYRRIGHQVCVRPPIDVPLEIELEVCVRDGFLRAHVQRELRERLGKGKLPDGTFGFFHPDGLSFGQSLYLSRLVSAARKVDGVENIVVKTFKKLNRPDAGEREAGVMTFGPFEIPRLDNDGLAPHLGQLTLHVQGRR